MLFRPAPICFSVCLLVGLLFFPVSPAVAAEVNTNREPIVMGWVEYVYVDALDARMKAKLDTGATTSSMRAVLLRIVRPKALENGKKPKRHVVFQVEDVNGRISTLERKLVRWVRIKDKDGGLQRRPVVEMDYCVGGHRVTSEVNLAPRETFLYPVLIGRNMLRDAHIVVDPARTFTSSARCVPDDSSKE